MPSKLRPLRRIWAVAEVRERRKLVDGCKLLVVIMNKLILVLLVISIVLISILFAYKDRFVWKYKNNCVCIGILDFRSSLDLWDLYTDHSKSKYRPPKPKLSCKGMVVCR